MRSDGRVGMPVDPDSGVTRGVEWFGIALGGVVTALGGKKALAKAAEWLGRNAEPSPRQEHDWDAMAAAFFARKAIEDERHREALTAAIDRQTEAMERMIEKLEDVAEVVRDANDKTRERIGTLLSGMATLLTQVSTKQDALMILLRNGGAK